MLRGTQVGDLPDMVHHTDAVVSRLLRATCHLTQLPPQGVPDELYERVRTQLSEQEIVELTHAVMAINAWNRANVAFRTVPGSLDAAFGLDKAQLT